MRIAFVFFGMEFVLLEASSSLGALKANRYFSQETSRQSLCLRRRSFEQLRTMHRSVVSLQRSCRLLRRLRLAHTLPALSSTQQSGMSIQSCLFPTLALLSHVKCHGCFVLSAGGTVFSQSLYCRAERLWTSEEGVGRIAAQLLPWALALGAAAALRESGCEASSVSCDFALRTAV